MPTTPGWPFGPEKAALAAGEVQVWTAWLDLDPDSQGRLAAALSDDERERVSRFVDARDAQRWSTGRGVLRDILGRYLGEAPASIRFAYGPHGAPLLDVPSARPVPLHFNVSHSGPLALYAVGLAHPVGVDVEEMVPGRDLTAVAEGFFSTRERDALAGLPEDARLPAFYRCWTRKEACLKGRGLGLHAPLDAIEVPLGDAEDGVALRVEGPGGGGGARSLTHLLPRDGWVGALAVEDAEPTVRRWTWCP